MRVHVLRNGAVTSGVATFETRCDSDSGKTVEVRISFNPKDLKASVVDEFTEALTIQARAWTPRDAAPSAAGRPVGIRVLRCSDLPAGVRMLVQATDSYSEYRFCAEAITSNGARGFEEMMKKCALHWTKI
jgi:hypothetical protein